MLVEALRPLIAAAVREALAASGAAAPPAPPQQRVGTEVAGGRQRIDAEADRSGSKRTDSGSKRRASDADQRASGPTNQRTFTTKGDEILHLREQIAKLQTRLAGLEDGMLPLAASATTYAQAARQGNQGPRRASEQRGTAPPPPKTVKALRAGGPQAARAEPSGDKGGPWQKVAPKGRGRRVEVAPPPAGPSSSPSFSCLQPSPASLGPYLTAGDATIILPAMIYAEERRKPLLGRRQIAPGKEAEDWPVGELPAEHRRVMMVGPSLWDCHRVARDALHFHAAIEEVQAVVPWSSGSKLQDALWQQHQARPEDLQVNHGRVEVTHSSRTLEWDSRCHPPAKAKGYHLWIRWIRIPEGEVASTKLVDLEVCVESRPPPRLVCILDPSRLRRPGDQKEGRVQGWAKERAWRAIIQANLEQPMEAPPPMAVLRRGEKLEVSFSVQGPSQARALLVGSGQRAGVEFRPWADRGSGPEEGLQASLVWLRVPDYAGTTEPYWKVLREAEDVPFGGLMEGDSVGRLGVRLWGPPAGGDLRRRVEEAVGASGSAGGLRVRVRGYPATFATSFGGKPTQAQREVDGIFGPGRVKVSRVTHLPDSGLERPSWDVLLKGAPPEWAGVIIPPEDARGRDKVWALARMRGSARPAQPVGRRQSLPVVQGPAGGEQESGKETDQDMEEEADEEVIEDDMEVEGARAAPPASQSDPGVLT